MHYEGYWGFSCAPFENVPDPRFYFPSPSHEEGLHRVLYAVEARKGAAMLTGDIGCGKTTLSRAFLQHLAHERFDTAVVANPALEAEEFLAEILYQLGLPSHGLKKIELLHRLNDRLLDNLKRKKDTVVIVDEAQAIEDGTVFEQLRLLLNFQLNDRFLLTLVLLGQPELVDRVNAIPQLSQRVGIRFHLKPFDLKETTRYLEFRVKAAGGATQPFAQDAVDMIYAHAGGIPRNINTVADLCLLSGFLERKWQIDAALVSRVIEDFQLGGVRGTAH